MSNVIQTFHLHRPAFSVAAPPVSVPSESAAVSPAPPVHGVVSLGVRHAARSEHHERLSAALTCLAASRSAL